MKKLFAFISVSLIAAAAMFAEVTVKKLDGGKLEVTFFYENPRATEVLLAGDFTSWQAGALPMTKTDKGFTLTKVFDSGTTLKYKFISDGNWTTDPSAPDLIDDGFGGKNGLAELDSLVVGSDDGAKKFPNVKFSSWTMLGSQAKFSTQKSGDATKKETKVENVALGFKSYNKLTGDLTGNMPFYIEIATSEKDYEDANVKLYDRNNNKEQNVELFKKSIGHLLSDPVTYLADGHTPDAWNENPFLGHLKFGWNTPYVNYTTGYVYAKLPSRSEITWATIADNWDAGYKHIGGFSLFENGAKLQQIGDNTLKVGINLNKSADRKGENYGSYAFATFDTGAWKFDAQWNTMYGKDYQFFQPVENDIILGAKGKISVVSLAVQGLIAIHNKSTEDLLGADYAHAGDWWKAADYFGYSTDVFYRSGKFDGIENIAANVKAGYKNDMFSVDAEYRLRGMEASMLYVRNNHDDADLRLRDMLGNPNSQSLTLKFGAKPMDALSIGLKATMDTELKHYDISKTSDADFLSKVKHCWANGYANGWEEAVLYDKAGAEFGFDPSVTYQLTDLLGFKSSVNAYAKTKYAAYRAIGESKDKKYGASDSKFLFNYAGIAFNAENLNDTISGLDVYYGLDNSNSELLFNTLIAQVKLPYDITVSGGIGIRSIKGTAAGKNFKNTKKDELNPFGIALGVAKKLSVIKSPIVYAQFAWNMDIYKGFGEGQDALNLNGANLGGYGYTAAVDKYNGAGALRVGMRWDF
ncbi:glycogen-binding domain-containing protein [Treponema sp. Marseille-Q3903]|uniref:glycogen-binding domain-containing protein n=1 Tax=Treponema sp. Marseille-Q3903 TaxID=2766703 RepID=UPI0016521FE1|nr:glycogen-binding domain-containing protein [Treponema sp. Marseille-Q3903]MBC6713045.1 hypothetical protein [Treponema sp. Marseille-Q3903]